MYHYEPPVSPRGPQPSNFGLTPTPKLLPDKQRQGAPCLECFKIQADDNSLPKNVQKKHKLLKRFKKELSLAIVEDSTPAYFLKFETISQIKQNHTPVFVENVRIKKQAVIFWFSNGSVQVNLASCCVILSHRSPQSVDTGSL